MVFSPKETPNSRIRHTPSAQRRVAVGRGWYYNQCGSAPRLHNTVHGGKFRRANRLLHLTSKLRCKVIATTGASAFSRAPALRSEPHRDGSYY